MALPAVEEIVLNIEVIRKLRIVVVPVSLKLLIKVIAKDVIV